VIRDTKYVPVGGAISSHSACVLAHHNNRHIALFSEPPRFIHIENEYCKEARIAKYAVMSDAVIGAG
jgi:hypothetical protein